LNTLPVAFFCSKRQKAKLVYDSHELYVERNKITPSSMAWKRILRTIEGVLVRRADAVFTVNETIAEILSNRYRIAKPLVLMNTPALCSNFECPEIQNGKLRSKLSISVGAQIILYSGAITFNRGLEQLIQSLQFLPSNYHLVFMGYGNEAFKQRLIKIAIENAVVDRFHFFGPVPSEQVTYYASDADLGVAPIVNACLSYYCCSPNKLFEYMNAGLPVAASNFPELVKVVIGHKIGTTFDPENPKDIARSVNKILEDSSIRNQMAKNAILAAKFYNL
jgi:glycosyltransferase involved in cell wall biosynthesis